MIAVMISISKNKFDKIWYLKIVIRAARRYFEHQKRGSLKTLLTVNVSMERKRKLLHNNNKC